MIELLSPAGDMESLRRAIDAGADAVYFAAKNFGARALAKNFDEYELREAAELCHVNRRKAYVTVNTLITDREMNKLLTLAELLDSIGIDALIVQDIGAAVKIKRELPHIKLHASTQMTIHNLSGVEILHNLGFERIVLSRELSLDEINYITSNTKCEIEVFIHGALCVSYSGLCQMSNLIGGSGRSANKGSCAGSCRLEYFKDKRKALSLKDLCGIRHIDRLKDSGVASLKIEGRMKSPEYVYTITSIYRKYIDYGGKITQKDMRILENAFRQRGLTDGYLSGNSDMFGTDVK